MVQTKAGSYRPEEAKMQKIAALWRTWRWELGTLSDALSRSVTQDWWAHTEHWDTSGFIKSMLYSILRYGTSLDQLSLWYHLNRRILFLLVLKYLEKMLFYKIFFQIGSFVLFSSKNVYVCAYVCMSVCLHVCMNVHACVCLCSCVCAHMYMHVWMYVCACGYVCLYV